MENWQEIAIRIGIIIGVAVVLRFNFRFIVQRAVKASSKRSLRSPEDGPAWVRPFRGRRKGKGDPRLEAVIATSGVTPEKRMANRTESLSHVLCLLVDWIIGIVALLTILTELGVKLAPLLTSAGIGGLVIGFGAQPLIKDFIAGMFLVLEGQYSVGDIVDVGPIRGVVQEIGTRVIRLQSSDGEIWYVRNGEITNLGNRSQGWLTSTVDIIMPAGTDPEAVIEVLQTVVEAVDADPEWHDRMLRPPEVAGLTSFDTTQMVFSIKVTCPQKSGVEQEIRTRALAALMLESDDTFQPESDN